MKYVSKFVAVLSLVGLVACSSNPFGSSDKKQDQGSNNLQANSAVAPAAQGNVSTSVDDNGNTQLDVNVKHLAQPEKLSPGAKAYVVWVKPEGQKNYQNVGTMKVNENLEGNYQTKVPYKNFNLMITPESSMRAQAPSGTTVMEKNVSI